MKAMISAARTKKVTIPITMGQKLLVGLMGDGVNVAEGIVETSVLGIEGLGGVHMKFSLQLSPVCAKQNIADYARLTSQKINTRATHLEMRISYGG